MEKNSDICFYILLLETIKNMTDEQLLNQNTSYIEIDGVRYFLLSEVKERIENVFVDVTKIIEQNNKKYIASNHLRPLTAFDKTIKSICKKGGSQ